MSTVAASSVDAPQQVPRCCFCSRHVVLPPHARGEPFVICTICERKMLSANAIHDPAARLQPSSGSPSGMVNPTQLTGQPQSEPKTTIVIKPRRPAPPPPVHPPLVIKLPAAAPSAAGTKRTSTAMHPGKQKPVLTVKVPPKRRPSQQTRMPPSQPPPSSGFSRLLARWAETEKAIATLTDQPHFNDKGEYLCPYPLSLSVREKNSTCILGRFTN